MHIAEFNIGRLKYDWDDPRIADFQSNLDRVYDIARRSKGYVWHLEGDQMEAAQLDASGPLGGDPRTASTLSVWQDVESLRAFTFNTVHNQFYMRKSEWYEAAEQPWPVRFVMWHIAPGQRPSIAEAVDRLTHLAHHGNTAFAFGWDYIKREE